MTPPVPAVKLSNNFEIPIIGLGTWKAKPDEVKEVVKNAIDVGYRHFDCAYFYENENEVGDALNEKIKEGIVKREELFITTKLWNTDHRKELVVPALKRSLDLLKMEYVDLYLIHWPLAFEEGHGLLPTDKSGKTMFSNASYLDTWKGMEDCVKLGLAKSIGLSNFNHKQIKKVLEIAEIKPVINQVECHPYLNQSKLIEFCTKNGITVTAYGPLGSPYRPLKPGATALLEDPVVKTVSEKYNKSPAQILIKYQIQRNVVVIPKTVTKSRLVNNIEVFDFTISTEYMGLLNSLNKPDGRYVLLENCIEHPDYPFVEEF